MNANPNPLGPSTDIVKMVQAMLAAGMISADQILNPQDTDAVTADRLAHLVPGEPITVRELVVKTKKMMKDSTSRTYNTYLNLLADGVTDPADPTFSIEGLGDRYAHHIVTSDLEVVLRFVEQGAIRRAEARADVRRQAGRATRDSNGSGAKYNAVGAWRHLFEVAIADRHLAKGYNPATDLRKPPRSNTARRPLPAKEMAEMWTVLGQTGNDPELDLMIAEMIIITGARREGLLNLTISDLDRVNCTVRLDEKLGKIVRQPVPDWFVEKLHRFAEDRGASAPHDQVFRRRCRRDGGPGTPITSRRLDYCFGRVQASLEWADRKQVTAHVLRHHAVALIERHAGFQVANRFARHEPDSVTKRYGQATEEEVARAVIEVHGGRHPLVEDH